MTTPLWTMNEIADALGTNTPSDGVISGVSIDSRTLEKGDLFFAVQGVEQDGHLYVRNAFEKGAAAAVVSKERAHEFEKLGTLFVVSDVLEGLNKLAEVSRRRVNAKIVAVTGSVGKTGTKEMLRLALSAQKKTHASVASYNNLWGVPLTLARMPRDTEYAVIEIGMNHHGEILPLTKLTRPHVTLITTVGPVHLEFFASVADISDAKSEIFAGIETGGVAILNKDNPYFERMKGQALASCAGRIISFGEEESADIRALSILEKKTETIVNATVFGNSLSYKIGTPGRHTALNSLGVLATVFALGGDVIQAAHALTGVSAPVGRGARSVLPIKGGEFTLIDEAYNANPASMSAAIVALGQTPTGSGGRRIAVLAPMRELGSTGPDLHCSLLDVILKNNVDQVLLAGDLMEHLYAILPEEKRTVMVKDSQGLVTPLIEALRAGDVVMVKGSLSTKMGLVVKALKEEYGK